MEHFKHIETVDVFPHLQAGKEVFVAVFDSEIFVEGVYNLSTWEVYYISMVVKEKDVVFYEKIESEG